METEKDMNSSNVRNGWAVGMAALSAVWSLSAGAADAPKSWTDSITLKGDLRYRFEYIDEENKDERYRDRIRARLNLEAKVDDRAKVGIGFSTGQSDPVSGNQSLGDGWGKKEFRLDLAYFDYQMMPDQLSVVGGRVKNPFICVQDLIWDGDLNMDGLALKGVAVAGDMADLMANAGYMWIQERSADDDTMMYGGQAAARLKLGESASLLLGGSIYRFTEMEGMDVIDWEKKNNGYGNKTTTGSISGTTTNKAYAYGFQEAEGFSELQIFVADRPLSIHGSYVVNTEADEDDTGYLVGVSYGKAKNPGQFEIGWNYREVEKNAVVGAFTDSDHAGGGANNEGHKFYVRYAINKTWGLAAAYFMDTKDLEKELDYNRYQFDVNLKF